MIQLLDKLLNSFVFKNTYQYLNYIQNSKSTIISKLSNQTHIDTNLTNPTVLDVIGGKKTIIQELILK